MKFTIALDPPAHEMACEEIAKQLAFLNKDLQDIQTSPAGDRIEFDAPPDIGTSLLPQAETLARRVERVLRAVPRKVIFRSAAADHPTFAERVDLTGISFSGLGSVSLQGIPLRLFRYFDRVFESLGTAWSAQLVLAPSLISERTLAQAGYFSSFPQHVTFATGSTGACLSPAACYHVYTLYENQPVPPTGAAYNVCGKCYRHEPGGNTDLRRLWEFTMRELVFLGEPATVLAARDRSLELISQFLDEHQLAAEIRTASDPFFLAPDALAKTYFQLKSDSKFEVSLFLPDGGRLAAGSLNYHADFFGRAFHAHLESGAPMHSVCVAFGLERWVYAFLVQHGSDPAQWPDVIRTAAEFLSAKVSTSNPP